jgi:hypothetical protein
MVPDIAPGEVDFLDWLSCTSRRTVMMTGSGQRLATSINPVERFCGLLTEKAVKRGSHTNLAQRRAAILA